MQMSLFFRAFGQFGVVNMILLCELAIDVTNKIIKKLIIKKKKKKKKRLSRFGVECLGFTS